MVSASRSGFRDKLGEGNLEMLVCQNLHYQVAVAGPAHTFYQRPCRQSNRTPLPAQSKGGGGGGPQSMLMSQSYCQYARPMVGILPTV